MMHKLSPSLQKTVKSRQILEKSKAEVSQVGSTIARISLPAKHDAVRVTKDTSCKMKDGSEKWGTQSDQVQPNYKETRQENALKNQNVCLRFVLFERSAIDTLCVVRSKAWKLWKTMTRTQVCETCLKRHTHTHTHTHWLINGVPNRDHTIGCQDMPS